jgi:hypothetical protein
MSHTIREPAADQISKEVIDFLEQHNCPNLAAIAKSASGIPGPTVQGPAPEKPFDLENFRKLHSRFPGLRFIY